MPEEVGRPTVFDESTLQKLEIAFSNDATDVQACFIANIAPSSLYNYQKAHPEFLERKRALKSMISYQAKSNLKELIYSQEKELEKERIEASKWILPKKEKESYSERQELTGPDGKELPAPILNYAICSNNSNAQDNGNDQTPTVSAGGDISIQDNINPAILDTPSAERQETNPDISGSGVNPAP